jgi:D-glycero-beta-D-manno-heptose 1-phosphate adenylyltransferase
MPISKKVAALLTIAYADQFSFPLTNEEIFQRLLKIPLSKSALKKTLMGLEKAGLIESHHQFWKLSSSETDWKVRQNREKLSQKKWQEVEKIVRTIGWIPWIKGIAVTGSLAVNNVVVHSDIDLMIVVAPRRLWISRVLVSLSTLWVGKLRTWRGNEKDSWCFNLWLDEKHLGLPKYKRNLYSAYEVCQSRWVLDKAGVERLFYQNNSWVKNFLPHFFSANYDNPMVSKLKPRKYRSAPVLRFISRKLLDLINFLVFILQYSHMYSHMSREIVSLSSAYFHPRSTRGQIYRRWHHSLQKLWKRGQRVVLVTGVFDILHQEHKNFLTKARQAGDILVVGLESDLRVKQLKGKHRPIENESIRLSNVSQFPVVDFAFILPEKFTCDQEHLNLLRLIKPDVLAVSSHTLHLKEKKRLMRQVGGRVVVVHKHNPKVSTTKILS